VAIAKGGRFAYVSNTGSGTISSYRVREGGRLQLLEAVEFISALAMKRRTGKINESTARRILSLFKKHRADHIYRLVPIEAREFAVATDWLESFHTSLRALDALHLAAAFTSGLILTTADKGLAESATLLGVKHELLS
jgi:predicted nucleic acid-binding protein